MFMRNDHIEKYYLIKSSCLNELKYIKKAIESSDIFYKTHKLETIRGYK